MPPLAANFKNLINIKKLSIMTLLTKENAPNVSTIINIAHPDWGTKAFTYEANDNSYHGRGCDSAMLFESEFKYWAVNSFK